MVALNNPGAPQIQVHLNIEIRDGVLDVSLEAAQGAIEALAVDILANPDEHYLGFGEHFNRIDQRGQEIDLWTINGASGNLAYKPVPFFMSSAGYAMRILNSERTLVRLARQDDPGVVSLRCESSVLRLQVWTGEPFEDLLKRYTELLGGALYEAPAWAFGPWKSRDWMVENQSTVEEDLHTPRQQRLAGSVKLIDAAWQSELNDFQFNDKFPDPSGMIAEAHRLGYKLILWVSPWMHLTDPPSQVYQYCAERGFLIRNTRGEPYVHRLGNSPDFMGTCLDFTNPGAVAWWQEQISRLVAMGVDGFKTDFGEQVPEDALFFNGKTGRQMHNLFPYLYNQATYAAMSRKTHGILLARSAWEGSQRMCAVWAGDQSADFGPATGFPSVIIAGQNAGLSGFAIWASDIGGYFCQPPEDVFARWIEFGAFSPIMQVHGMGCHEPWHYSERILDIYRRYAQVHTDLFPYIYTHARRAAATGVPIMRAMVLAFPKDKGIWDEMVDHQYCFGSELLVAPVYSGSNEQRHLYLPAGKWLDFWTGVAYDGGMDIRVHAELDHIPVFARAGAIIPLLDPSPDTLVDCEIPGVRVAGQDLRLQIYPGDNGAFELYDGTVFEWRQDAHELIINQFATPRWISVRCMARAKHPTRVIWQEGHPIELLPASLSGDSGYWRFYATEPGVYRVTFTQE